MSEVVISAEGLGKKYVIGHQAGDGARYTALRDVIARQVRGFGRSAMDLVRGRPNVAGDDLEDFWALKDINFEIRRGDVVGVIGRNGAGKSTLLKILSRITEPSKGRATIDGRVASLLEVGTGFHPELTGRENIYLNGAILGMGRAEIRRKFEEIVDFAGIETFLDTPVKRYSSGMYVRLAFAVAAHLEPEVLIVDEVLAVGDAEFQKKCLGKMQDVAGHGRTVLFVSHNMSAVLALCKTGILMRQGSIELTGSVDSAVTAYMSDVGSTALKGRQIDVDTTSRITSKNNTGAVCLRFCFTVRGPLARPRIAVGVNDAFGNRIATIFSETAQQLPALARGETIKAFLETEPVRLAPGVCTLKIALADNGSDIEVHEDAIRLIIPDYMAYARPPYSKPRGVILLPIRILEWSDDALPAPSA